MMLKTALATVTAAAIAAVSPAQAKDKEQKDNDKDKHSVTAAPEVDPASAFSALTLLAGGLAVFRGRRKGD
jgi:hypothetical protein